MVANVLRTVQQPGLSALGSYSLRRWAGTIEALEDVQAARDLKWEEDEALGFLTREGLSFTDPLTKDVTELLQARERAMEAKRAAAELAERNHRNKLARARRKAKRA